MLCLFVALVVWHEVVITGDLAAVLYLKTKARSQRCCSSELEGAGSLEISQSWPSYQA